MLDSGTKVAENRIHLFDPVGLINDSYGSYRSSSYAVRPRHPIKSYDSFNETNGVVRSDDSLTDSNNGGLRSHHDHSSKDMNGGGGGGELRFGVDLKLVEDDDESDASTPRLWKLKPVSVASPPQMHPTSPKSYTSPGLHPASPNHHHQYQSMSARTQVIAKGRRELMDMVRDLPESFYELSLKDIVDQKLVMEDKKEINQPEEKKVVMEIGSENKAKKQRKKSGKIKKSESKKKMVRSKSVDSGGFLLKTSVFPSFMASKKRKKSSSVAANSFKIAPKPKPKPKPQQPSRTRSIKGREKDWWKRKSCISSESDESAGLSSNSASSSSSSSSRSNSSNGRRSNRFLRSFCFFNGRRIRDKI